jgi:carboxypeptidase Taq
VVGVAAPKIGPLYALTARLERIGALGEAGAVLQWDVATQMPPGGATARGEQLAALAAVQHALLTDGAMADELSAAEAVPDLDPWQRANIALARRQWQRAMAMPVDLISARARAETACEQAWRRARADKTFATVRAQLEELIGVVREQAHALGEALSLSPYDSLLDGFHAGGRQAHIGPMFDKLTAELPPLIDAIIERQASAPARPLPSGPVDTHRQKALAHQIIGQMGFDFAHGRLDESAHPFCGGTPDDVRITMRIDPDDPLSCIMAVLHETGHALYERGLPTHWRRQPVGEANGMAIHESQSLLIEMQVARSRPFARYLANTLAQSFGWADNGDLFDRLLASLMRVRRSLIRVDADEATYPLHVAMRFRLESALVAGTLKVADLPDAWIAAQQDVLGITPAHDGEGCLQDIHWYGGAVGYFPTYTLGAITAAQLFKAASTALPDIETDMAAGNLAPLIRWLGENVHSRGSLETPDALVARVTGRPPDPDALIDHLRARYLG